MKIHPLWRSLEATARVCDLSEAGVTSTVKTDTGGANCN